MLALSHRSFSSVSLFLSLHRVASLALALALPLSLSLALSIPPRISPFFCGECIWRVYVRVRVRVCNLTRSLMASLFFILKKSVTVRIFFKELPSKGVTG